MRLNSESIAKGLATVNRVIFIRIPHWNYFTEHS